VVYFNKVVERFFDDIAGDDSNDDGVNDDDDGDGYDDNDNNNDNDDDDDDDDIDYNTLLQLGTCYQSSRFIHFFFIIILIVFIFIMYMYVHIAKKEMEKVRKAQVR